MVVFRFAEAIIITFWNLYRKLQLECSAAVTCKLRISGGFKTKVINFKLEIAAALRNKPDIWTFEPQNYHFDAEHIYFIFKIFS